MSAIHHSLSSCTWLKLWKRFHKYNLHAWNSISEVLPIDTLMYCFSSFFSQVEKVEACKGTEQDELPYNVPLRGQYTPLETWAKIWLDRDNSYGFIYSLPPWRWSHSPGISGPNAKFPELCIASRNFKLFVVNHKMYIYKFLTELLKLARKKKK